MVILLDTIGHLYRGFHKWGTPRKIIQIFMDFPLETIQLLEYHTIGGVKLVYLGWLASAGARGAAPSAAVFRFEVRQARGDLKGLSLALSPSGILNSWLCMLYGPTSRCSIACQESLKLLKGPLNTDNLMLSLLGGGRDGISAIC